MMTKVDTGVVAYEKGGWIVKVGQHLFVAGSYGLAVVDCSDPANAKKVRDDSNSPCCLRGRPIARHRCSSTCC